MRLAPRVVWKGVEDAKRRGPELDPEPCRGRRFLLNDGETTLQKLLHLFFLSGFRFERHEQCNFDHDVPLRLRRLRAAERRNSFGLANVIPGSRAAKMPPRSNDSAANGRAGGDVTGRLVRDLRTAWRGLLRARGLSLAAMISLAIGIG